MRPTWLLVAIAGLLLAAACSEDAASDEATATPAATPSARATASPTATGAASPEATATATPKPENLLAFLYIAHTGGDGVSIRDACRDDAHAPGAWAEGTAVRVIEPGTDACAGWTYVVGPGEGSWVRADYLSATPPAVKTPPGSSNAPGPPPPPR